MRQGRAAAAGEAADEPAGEATDAAPAADGATALGATAPDDLPPDMLENGKLPGAAHDAATNTTAAPEVAESRLSRRVWLWLGWLNMGLAALGAVLPIMPTVIFLIFAAACFARSNPVLERKLLEHPVFGEHIVAWRERRAITRIGKWGATLGMAGGAAFGLFFLPEPWRYVGSAAALLVLPWIWTRPER